MERKYIYNSYLAKRLLNLGNPIVDLTRDLKDKNRIIFVFDDTVKLKMDMQKLTK